MEDGTGVPWEMAVGTVVPGAIVEGVDSKVSRKDVPGPWGYTIKMIKI